MTVSFPEMEKEILALWQEKNIFKKTLEKTKPATPNSYRRFVFYDGPPFATGLPHHGHILTSTIKDIIPRFRTMQGKYVERRWGWDCHGLPIEHEIDKALGMSAQEAVKKLGIKGYNDKCREIVGRYTAEWQKTIERLGRWVDFDDHYKTMDASYMESVWWVFRELWNKDLVYPGTKVMPYSTALRTPISNFEASSNFQEVQDPAVVVLFEEFYDTTINGPPASKTYYATWTTTPWTLPANLALCVNSSVIYVKVHVAELNADIVIAKDCVKNFEQLKDAPVIEEFEGDALIGNLYLGLFPFSEDFDKTNSAFVVLGDDYVKTDTGTGIVHLAPSFGEDDARVAADAEIDSICPCPIDDAGCFTDQVPPYAGMYVKDADSIIIKDLKEQGKIFDHSTITHKYPFCPRSDTPLIYKAVPAWYVAVEKIKDKLVRTNKIQTTWVPKEIRDGRFGNWLENAKDWCVSRNRIWGTPIPIWVNDVTNEAVCVGSLRDLKEASGQDLPEDFDLHRENVDEITFTREGEEGVYRRIPEVFDCWFESGAMPYAQIHHPFNRDKKINDNLPADFIAEGLDQTRGWFYTLMVLSVALQNKPAFKNVIVSGIVLAADGKKMSKRLRNYTDPNELLEKYGADAFRLYLINSGLVNAESLHFEDEGLAKITRRVLLPLLNAFTFFDTYATADDWKAKISGIPSQQVFDKWITSRMNSLTMKVVNEMNSYKLGNILPEIFKFIDDLTNWYIRLNRRRFYAKEMTHDKHIAFSTLFEILHKLTRILAPFAPFLTDYIYQRLSKYGSVGAAGPEESVHLTEFPDFSFSAKEETLEKAVVLMRQIITMGRRQRDEAGIKIKIPLSKLTIIAKWEATREIKDKLESYIKAELNVKTLEYDSAVSNFVEYYAKPNFSELGKRLGDKMQDFKIMIETLDNEDLTKLEDGVPILLDGEILDKKEIIVLRRPLKDSGIICNEIAAIKLDLTVDNDLLREGLAREIVNTLQKARKAAGLDVSDRIQINYNCDFHGEIKKALEKHAKYIMGETLATTLSYIPDMGNYTKHFNGENQFEETEIAGQKLRFKVKKFVPVLADPT